MKLDKFLWSKAKTDILKYLFFKRQWVSLRALENELDWTFPAIKKQTDMLLQSNILRVDKENNKWSIFISDQALDLVKKILYFSLESEIGSLFSKYDTVIENYFLWKVFWKDIDSDLVIIYRHIWEEHLEVIKDKIGLIFRDYFLEKVRMTSFSSEDFSRRYRLADKFVLNLISANKY